MTLCLHVNASKGKISETLNGVSSQTRAAISKIIDDAAQVEKHGDTSNLNELANMFPDEFDPAAPGNRLLKTKTSNPRISQGLAVTSNEASGQDADENQGSEQNQERNEKSDGKERQKEGQRSNPREGSNQGSGSDRGRRPRLARPRLVATSHKTAIICVHASGRATAIHDNRADAGR